MKKQGTFFIIGGGKEDEQHESEILQPFVTAAKKRKGHIVVFTVPTKHPQRSMDGYEEVFKRLGAQRVVMVDVSQRPDAFSKQSIKLIQAAAAIYATGGNQLNVTALMGGTPMETALQEAVERGVIIAGTSAGAAMLSSSMFISGNAETNPTFAECELGAGLDVIKNTILETHCSNRGRLNRIITAVSQNPRILGIGIDENTAIVLKGSEFEVIGRGTVTIVDGRSISYNSLSYVEKDESPSTFDLKVHRLSKGDTYNLETRMPTGHQL